LNLKTRSIPNPSRRSERGYILITLILFVALIAVAATVMLPIVVFQVKRDREEELIHRGVQYSRAMKHFVKKFGRYPTRLEELENTNQVRFLRKRYKDPITGKDFKLLHVGEVQMSFGAGIAGATPAGGLNPGAAGINGGLGGPSGPGGPGALANSALNTFAAAGGLAAAAGANAGNFAQATSPNTAVTQIPGQPSNDDSASNAPGSGPNQGGSFAAAGPGAPGAFGAVNTGNSPNPQVFGGGPIVGVASTSKDKTIRIFNKKEHYNEWQFIYDPTTYRGGLLTTPNQPSLQGATSIQGTQGTLGAPGTAAGTPGQPGFGNQPSQPNQPGPQTPQMPPEQP
jgi:type II secretory pathway pseudopilin PulG